MSKSASAAQVPSTSPTPAHNLYRHTLLATAMLAVAGLALLGCGDAGKDVAGITTSASTSSSTTIDESKPGSAATLGVATTSLGDVLVTGSGRTLYLFTPDGTDGATCVDECAKTWPPLTTEGTPTGKDLSPDLLGTIERKDSSTQVTAGGHPVYTYSGDSQKGDTNGQGIGGTWFAVGVNGRAIKDSPSSGEAPPSQPY